MHVTDDELKALAQEETAHVTMCYHGIMVTHQCPEPGSGKIPMYMVRLVGHMLNGIDMENYDLNSKESVPDHMYFSIDIPFFPEIIGQIMQQFTGMAAESIECQIISDFRDKG